MKNVLLVIGIIFLGFHISYGQENDSILPINLEEINIESDRMIAPLSVLDLLINPNAYKEAIIKVEGYFICEFEHCAIYFSKEGLENRMSSQAIWINSDNSKVKGISNNNNKLVIIYAKYKVGPSGHGGMFRGELYDIEDIIVSVRN